MWSPIRERRRNQCGFSLIELLVVIALILIILSIALPKMGIAQMHAREIGAIATLKTIHTVQLQYQSQFWQYATSLAQLNQTTQLSDSFVFVSFDTPCPSMTFKAFPTGTFSVNLSRLRFGVLTLQCPIGLWSDLGPPAGAGSNEGAQAANLISGNLASGSTGGYHYTVTQTPTGYAALAVPKVFNNTGRRSYYSDQSGVIRESTTQEPATAHSPEVK